MGPKIKGLRQNKIAITEVRMISARVSSSVQNHESRALRVEDSVGGTNRVDSKLKHGCIAVSTLCLEKSAPA